VERNYCKSRIITGDSRLPQVMEVVLDFVMAYLEFLTSKLEATAHPILDSIVHKACLLDNRWDRLIARLRPVAWRITSPDHIYKRFGHSQKLLVPDGVLMWTPE